MPSPAPREMGWSGGGAGTVWDGHRAVEKNSSIYGDPEQSQRTLLKVQNGITVIFTFQRRAFLHLYLCTHLPSREGDAGH